MQNRCLLTLACVGLICLTAPLAEAEFVFGTPAMLPAPLNSQWLDLNPCISSDGLDFYFTSTRPGGLGSGTGWGSWLARRKSVSEAFGVPEPVSSLIHPKVSSDGLSLYVNGGNGAYGKTDVFVHQRPSTDSEWFVQKNLGSNINSSANDRWCDISADGRELYFTRDSGPVASNEIWIAHRSDPSQPFSPATRAPGAIHDGGNAGGPIIHPDGLKLVFTSTRDGGFGAEDFWICERETLDSPWGTPVNLGPQINTRFNEAGGDFSPDGRVFYFSRSRTPYTESDFDLWQVAIVPEPTMLFMLLTLCGLGLVWRWTT